MSDPPHFPPNILINGACLPVYCPDIRLNSACSSLFIHQRHFLVLLPSRSTTDQLHFRDTEFETRLSRHFLQPRTIRYQQAIHRPELSADYPGAKSTLGRLS
jgi:hypothetical protein